MFLLGRERQLLQKALAGVLEEEREAHVIKSRLTNALLSINRLPDEVLSGILLFSLHEHREKPWGCPTFSVCQRWRACAVRTPFLWSTIKVTRSSTFEQVYTLLDRSRAVPLRVEFLVDGTKALGTFNAIHHLIGQHYSRCCRLSITVSIKDIPSIFPLVFNLENLDELEVTCLGEFDGHAPPQIQLFDLGVQSISPTLREVTLYAERENSRNKLFDITSVDATSLTRLNIGNTVAPEGVWSVLQSCTSLEILGWKYNGHIEPPPINLRIVIPSLRSLTLALLTPSQFFRAVKAPRLLHTSIRLPTANIELRAILLLSDLHHLRFIELQFIMDHIAGPADRLENSIFFELFAELHSVEEIRIGGWFDENVTTLQCLTLPLPDTLPPTPYCPNLQHLTLDVRRGVDLGYLRLDTIGRELAQLRPKRKMATNMPLTVYIDFGRFKRDTSLDFGPSSDIRFSGEWNDAEFRERAMATIERQRDGA